MNMKKSVERVFRVKLSKEASDEFDDLIERQIFISYAEALRHAIELLLKEQRPKIQKLRE